MRRLLRCAIKRLIVPCTNVPSGRTTVAASVRRTCDGRRSRHRSNARCLLPAAVRAAPRSRTIEILVALARPQRPAGDVTNRVVRIVQSNARLGGIQLNPTPAAPDPPHGLRDDGALPGITFESVSPATPRSRGRRRSTRARLCRTTPADAPRSMRGSCRDGRDYKRSDARLQRRVSSRSARCSRRVC